MPTLLQAVLHNALAAAKICDYDTSNVKYIENPYGSKGVVTQQAIAGTYSVAAYTSTDDTLTVTEEFVWSEQVYDFEKIAQIADIRGSRMQEATAQMGMAIDKYVLNAIGTDCTGTYTTPVGGFSTGANIIQILGDLGGLSSGSAATYKGMYLVIESTDLTGFYQAGAASGFSYADAWLKNGRLSQFLGWDLYVLRAGTFVTATLGTKSVTMNNKRLAGIYNTTTYCQPAGRVTWMEKEVSGKTGFELAMAAYCGAKVWFQKAILTIAITLQ